MSIHFENPFKECVLIVGVRQEGKSNLFAWLLNMCIVPLVVFDTMGVISKSKWRPTRPKTQRIVKPSWGTKTPLFLSTCNEVWEQGNVIFAIEEISAHCTKHKMPPELDSLINLGGNRNIGMWFTTRRVAEVHNDIIANCQHHFIFRTYLPQDVEWYSGVVPRNVIEMSKNLPKYHFIYYKLGEKPVLFKPVKKML